MLYSCTYMATVGVKGLTLRSLGPMCLELDVCNQGVYFTEQCALHYKHP